MTIVIKNISEEQVKDLEWLFDSKVTRLPPHGDLIDRDALNNAFTGMRFDADGLLLHWGDREDWYLKGSEVETLITNATTIIEAEPDCTTCNLTKGNPYKNGHEYLINCAPTITESEEKDG